MTEEKTVPYANSVFEQPWWLDTVAPGAWGEALVRDAERVIARLPYCFEHDRIHLPVYTQTLGIWMSDELRQFERGNSQLHRQKEVIAELLAQLPKAREVEMTLDSSLSYVLPFRWNGFRIEPSFSYRIRELSDPEAVRSRYGKTVNKNIKAAARTLRVTDGVDDCETLLRLMEDTYARQKRGLPNGRELTERIVRQALTNQAGKLLFACDGEGVAHSALFLLYDHNVCYYLMSGQDSRYKSDGSVNLLLASAIDFASGVSAAFDFEGSMIEGIENLFRQFGGEIVTNYRVSRQSLVREAAELLKPRVKKLIGYKI